MKKLLFAIIALTTFFAGCQTDNAIDNQPIADGTTTISVSLEPTRTSLGSKNESGLYPVYWSEGDRIVVNGVLSDEAEIDSANSANAEFNLNASLSYPLSILYPYTSSTTADRPIVEFPAEQKYTEGGFASGYAPMCGYAAEKGSTTRLSHLTAILRLPVKAASEGVILDKIVIASTSGAKIAGEFEVDCANAKITATQSAQKQIIYSLPANYALSTDKASVFHITLPAVNVGNCTVEFVESSGKKMVASWCPSKPLDKGIVREFKEIEYKPQSGITLEVLPVQEDEFIIYYNNIYGNVRYSDGSPIKGVAVSDGFQVTSTDENGYYELNGVTPDSRYIYCSTPEEVKIPIDEFGRPCFFQAYPTNTPQYDFTFEKLPNGKEEQFALIALADTQVANLGNTARYKVQVSPEMRNFSQEIGIPCYGVALGDLVYCSAANNAEHLLYEMRDAFYLSGIPTFAIMGNHDNAHFSTTKPMFAGETNSNYNLSIQRPFEECFGPINFSFNRGEAHIVGMRNIQWTSNTHPDGGHITATFTNEQVEWLRQDLAATPKSKTLLFCVHIPLLNNADEKIQAVLTLLDQFDDVYILSGHYHYRLCFDHTINNTGHKAFEQVWSAVIGTNWGHNTNIACDGAPSGYGVVVVNGGDIVKSLHKGYPYGMNSLDYQIRLHRGGDITGAEISGTNADGTKGYYQFPYDRSVILANVFSSDPWHWSVEVWNYDEETGKRTTKIGNMTSLSQYSDTPTFDQLVGSFTYDDPMRPAAGVESGRDFWTAGIICGYLGKPVKSNYHSCRTMWKFTLPDPDAKVMVVARDRWGNEFTQTDFQVGTDFGYALYDENKNPQ